MKQYTNLINEILETGEIRSDRTGTGTTSIFGHQMRFNLKTGFPLLTLKKVPFQNIVSELIWFLNGDTNVKFLQDHKNPIWNQWATEDGELGPVYGKMWRSWPTTDGGYIDQIQELIDGIKIKPHSRRHIVSGWNPELLPDESISPIENAKNGKQALPPCHTLFQFYVSTNNELSCQLYQRSCDTSLGLPFNIASYALLTHMVAKECGLGVKDFIWTGGDCHVYNNHIEEMKKVILLDEYPLPSLWLNPEVESIFNYKPEDIKVVDYQSHPFVKLPIAI
jgi:thymidylate synthase